MLHVEQILRLSLTFETKFKVELNMGDLSSLFRESSWYKRDKEDRAFTCTHRDSSSLNLAIMCEFATPLFQLVQSKKGEIVTF